MATDEDAMPSSQAKTKSAPTKKAIACKFHKKGKCKRGSRCKFLHEQEAPIQQPTPAATPILTRKTVEEQLRKELLVSTAAGEWARMKTKLQLSADLSSVDTVMHMPGFEKAKHEFLRLIHFANHLHQQGLNISDQPRSAIATEADTGGPSFDKVVTLFQQTMRELGCWSVTVHRGSNPGDRAAERMDFQYQFVKDEYTESELLFIMNKKLMDRYDRIVTLEGGPTGDLAKRFVQRVLKSAKNSTNDNSEDLLDEALHKVYHRQAARMPCQDHTLIDRGKADSDWSLTPPPADELFHFTKEDLLGLAPTFKLHDSTVWQELEAMIGLSSVKSSVRAFADRVATNYRREMDGLEPIASGLSRLFIGPPGTGKTTIGQLYGRLLAECGLLSKGDTMIRNASDFIGAYVGHSEMQTKKILDQARGSVLLIDEAYMLNPKPANSHHTCPYRQAAIDTLVGEVQNTPNEDRCVILMGYKEELVSMLRTCNPGLSRRFPVEDAFEFEEFSDEELSRVLDLKLKKSGIAATIEAKTTVAKMLRLAKMRPNFGNGGEVENLLSRAKTNYEKRLSGVDYNHGSAEMLLEAEDFDPAFQRSEEADYSIAALFADFIGVHNPAAVFEKYCQVVKNMKARGLDPKNNVPFAFVFKGPPGTGKTTTARKIGKIYYDLGLLSSTDVVEGSVADMQASYLGQTAEKVRKLLDSALGKVLFIDEAYRLSEQSGHSYMQEARDELVDCMTKPKYFGKLVVVLAGYDGEMEKMLSANPGLASRFATHIDFRGLSAPECVKLLAKKIQSASSARVDLTGEDSNGRIDRQIKMAFEELAQMNGWGNGRDVENISKEVVSLLFAESAKDADLVVDGALIMEVLNTRLDRMHL